MHKKLRSWMELFDLIEEPQRSAIETLFRVTESQRREMPGSLNRHHSWPGGWESHTLEVTNNIVSLYESLPLPETALQSFTLSEAVVAAIVHDIDKLLYRYERSTNAPTAPQIGKARSLGINLDDLETKESLSEKISAAVEGRQINAHRLPRHAWRNGAMAMEDGAIVAWLCSRYRIPLTENVLHAVCFHHGGWNATIRETPAIEMSPLAVLLHAADSISSKIQNGDA